jgi:hypothetical protein
MGQVDKNELLDAYTADFIRHWHPGSQRYAGCDQLLTLMDDGWSIEGEISFDEYWHGGARRVVIYGFKLSRQQESVEMRVLANPRAERLVNEAENSLVAKRMLPETSAAPKSAMH